MPAFRPMATSVRSRSPTITRLVGGDAEPVEEGVGHVDAGFADNRLGAAAGAGLDGRQHGGAVGEAAVGGGAVRVGVRGDDGGAGVDRLVGPGEFVVVEGPVKGDNHDVGLQGVVGQGEPGEAQ